MNLFERINHRLNEAVEKPTSLSGLLSQYGEKDAKIVSNEVSPGRKGNPARRIIVIGVSNSWLKALESNILRYKFAKKEELTTNGMMVAKGFDNTISLNVPLDYKV